MGRPGSPGRRGKADEALECRPLQMAAGLAPVEPRSTVAASADVPRLAGAERPPERRHSGMEAASADVARPRSSPSGRRRCDVGRDGKRENGRNGDEQTNGEPPGRDDRQPPARSRAAVVQSVIRLDVRPENRRDAVGVKNATASPARGTAEPGYVRSEYRIDSNGRRAQRGGRNPTKCTPDNARSRGQCDE